MAASTPSPSGAGNYTAKLTPYVVLSCIMAGSGGLMYGYDLVVAGGIAVMDDFLVKFYPDVLVHKKNANQDTYCRYKNDVFQLFASCLYLSALPSTFLASSTTRHFGRRSTMLIASMLFILGTVMGTAAQNLGMLLSGRMLLGGGLGFSNQAVNLYLAEVAPPRLRGGLGYTFTVFVSLGIVLGNVVNYFAESIHPWGWRLSLGVAGIPAILFTVFSLLILESPSSLIQRGHHDQAKKVLAEIRGSSEIEAEFQELLDVIQNDDLKSNSFRKLLERQNIPQLVMGITFPILQQVTGNDAILFYGTFLFKTAGFGDQAALYSAVIVGVTSFLANIVALCVVDRSGRRRLLLSGATVMLSTMVAMACVFATGLQGMTQKLSRGEGIVEVVVVCLFVFAFFGTLGPLAWIIPSEVYSLEVRSAGLSVTVCINMLFKFIVAQTFLSMLCAFKYAIFLFFGGWVVVTIVFVTLFLPETKGVPIHGMHELWAIHWFWKRVVPHFSPEAYKTIA